MDGETAVFGAAVALVTAGVAALLAGEYLSIEPAIYGGGAVAILGMAIVTLGIMRIEESSEHGA